jgi:hypothetical protein
LREAAEPSTIFLDGVLVHVGKFGAGEGSSPNDADRLTVDVFGCPVAAGDHHFVSLRCSLAYVLSLPRFSAKARLVIDFS